MSLRINMLIDYMVNFQKYIVINRSRCEWRTYTIVIVITFLYYSTSIAAIEETNERGCDKEKQLKECCTVDVIRLGEKYSEL